MTNKKISISDLEEKIAEFNRERNWEQFHAPKNLAISISIEAAELLELFQWEEYKVEEILKESKTLGKLAEEMADLLIYLLNLATILNIDLSKAVLDKLSQNATKYPIEKSRGIAKKYTEL